MGHKLLLVEQEFIKLKGKGMAAGIINGMGSIGQMFSGFFAVAISQQFGWENLFKFFIIMAVLGGRLDALKWNFKSPHRHVED